MKILSIDVGIKNLAFCLLESNIIDDDINKNSFNDFKIMKWDTINLTEFEKTFCCEFEKKCKCMKPIKYKKNSSYYCLKHAKKQNLIIPTQELTMKFINKQKIPILIELAENYNIKY